MCHVFRLQSCSRWFCILGFHSNSCILVRKTRKFVFLWLEHRELKNKLKSKNKIMIWYGNLFCDILAVFALHHPRILCISCTFLEFPDRPCSSLVDVCCHTWCAWKPYISRIDGLILRIRKANNKGMVPSFGSLYFLAAEDLKYIERIFIKFRKDKKL